MRTLSAVILIEVWCPQCGHSFGVKVPWRAIKKARRESKKP